MVPLKLVSLNSYLVCRPLNKNRVTCPEKRAQMIHDFIRPFDMCFLQEVWGSGFTELTFPVKVKDDKTKKYSFWNLPPGRTPFLGQLFRDSIIAEFVYTVYLNWRRTGGLHDMTRDAVCAYRSKHTFSKSRSKSQKGVEATFWTDIHAWDAKYTLLVFNTHLDPPWKPEYRMHQMQEVKNFIRSVVDDLEKKDSFVLSQMGVLVVGDFNVKAHNSIEYKSFFELLEWSDLLESVYVCGEMVDGFEGAAHTYAIQNRLACCPDDYGRIDHVFAIRGIGKKQFLPLISISSEVIQQTPGNELSDHYPVAIDLFPANEARMRTSQNR